MNTPVTKKLLKDHLTYSWWKYALLILLAWMGWSIIYSVSAPRTPEDKKIIVGVYSASSDMYLAEYMQQVQSVHMQDMEQMEPMYILPGSTHGEMTLTTRMYGKDCDIFILPTSQFQGWASQGAFQPLDERAPELVAELEAAGIGLSRGERTIENKDEKHLYGIPCRDLPGALQLLLTDPTDMYICVFHDTQNDDNVYKFLDILVQDMMTEPSAATAEPAPAQ